jgi:acylphosphatase
VGFRSFVQETAARSSLTGWVRNLGYDQVEVLAEGSREMLERFAEQIKIGPPAGRVVDARLAWETGTGEFTGFGVRSSR